MILTTTTVTVTRHTQDGDPYEPADDETIAYASVPGRISSPSGTDRAIGGDTEVITAVAYLPADVVLERTDVLTDDATGEAHHVVWSRLRRGLGLDHVQAGLRQVNGASNG